MEIVAYATEYLSNFYTDEEIASMRNAKLKDSLAKIYGEDEDEFFDDDVPEDEIPVDE